MTGEPAATRIAEVRHRTRVTITGVIRSVAADSVGAAAAVRCALADGSGQVDLIFLGRERVAGLVPGRGCTVTGRVSVYRGRLVIWNPRYELDPAGAPAGTEGRVLVVGDDAALCRIVEVNLTARGYRVSAVPSAAAFGSLADGDLPADGGQDLAIGHLSTVHLAVVDLGLARPDEVGIVAALRARARSVPILAISARGGEDVRRAAEAAGADDFLAKPFPIGALLDQVTTHRIAVPRQAMRREATHDEQATHREPAGRENPGRD